MGVTSGRAEGALNNRIGCLNVLAVVRIESPLAMNCPEFAHGLFSVEVSLSMPGREPKAKTGQQQAEYEQ